MSRALSPAEAEFWLDTDKYANYFEEHSDPSKGLIFNIDMVRLSSIRAAIANFVRILTRKNIPVYFNDANANVNFGGKLIYISAKITSKYDFDIAVGQALHEAAHTLLTDFDSVKIAWTNIPHKIFQLSDAKNIRRASIEKFIHNTWNVIEDRYIDNYVFNKAPGYRGYYAALYDAFWNCPEVDAYLVSDHFRYPSLDSYDYRITNFTNENTDLTALPRLDEIADIIDIEHIGRLKTTPDRIQKAFEVVEVVLNCLDLDPPSGGNGSSSRQRKKAQGLVSPEDFFDFGDGGSEASDEEQKEEPEKNGEGQEDTEDLDVGTKMVGEIADVMSGRDPEPEKLKENKDCVSKISDEELTKEQQKEIKDMVETQRKFLHGELPKQAVTAQEKELLDLIEKHGIVLVRVDAPKIMSGDDKGLKVDCIVVQKMTKELVLSGQDMFPLCGVMKMGDTDPECPPDTAEAVRKGISLGAKLGRKLQIRNEINPIRNIRKRSGKINKRQLHEAAFDALDLFYNLKIEEHNKATLHITVDASSSMIGEKWNTTMLAVVAICKATSMIDNVHVTVSFRSTQDCHGSCLPYVVLAYDSKKDKFSKVKQLFPYLKPHGFTPEGLAFGAIMNLFENITPDEEERYFLNLSDGEPCYFLTVPSTGHRIVYNTEIGATHTKSQVDKIRRLGVEIMSYFIEDTYYTRKLKPIDKMTEQEKKEYKKEQAELDDSPLRKAFRKMYGKNAQFIDVKSIVDLARTMNGLFLNQSLQKRS